MMVIELALLWHFQNKVSFMLIVSQKPVIDFFLHVIVHSLLDAEINKSVMTCVK